MRRRVDRWDRPWAACARPPPHGSQQSVTGPVRIDGHLHIWSDDTARYPWSPINGASPPTIQGGAEWLLGVLDRHGVAQAVAVQTRAYGHDNAYLLDAAARFPDRIIPVVALDPRDPLAPASLRVLVARGARGLRLDPLGDGGAWLHDDTIVPLWESASERGIAIELMVRPEQLHACGTLARRTPELPIVIEHVALYDVPLGATLAPLLALARLPNVFVKLSALESLSQEAPPHTDLWDVLHEVAEAFGPSRLLWGSDMPWIGEHGYASSLSTMHALPFLTDPDRAWVLGGTARRIWGGRADRQVRT